MSKMIKIDYFKFLYTYQSKIEKREEITVTENELMIAICKLYDLTNSDEVSYQSLVDTTSIGLLENVGGGVQQVEELFKKWIDDAIADNPYLTIVGERIGHE